jgi:hypothetical protein
MPQRNSEVRNFVLSNISLTDFENRAKGRSALTFSSHDAAKLAHGLRITPAILESRRRSQPGGGFLLTIKSQLPLSVGTGRRRYTFDGGGGNLPAAGLGWKGATGNGRFPNNNSNERVRIAFCSASMLTHPCGA